MAENSRSFADPVHGFITLDKRDALENLMLEIIDTQTFQRLRGIKQLGITYEVYPSATHTRFSHSLGTFAVAREICDIIKKQGFEDKEQRDITLAAALLHDIGHGPQSHVFEFVSKKYFGFDKSHEEWGNQIITGSPDIRDKLEAYYPGFSKKVADCLIMKKEEKGLYPAIISSSLDADRLDYLLRDRYFSGISGCSIDKTRIINSLQVLEHPETKKLILAVKSNGMDSVEEFLRSRVSLYHQIYLHRREQAHVLSMGSLFEEIAKKKYLLDDKYSPLERFMKGDFSLENYLQTTDADMVKFIARMYRSDDKRVAFFAGQVLNRSTYKCHEIKSSLDEKRDIDGQLEKINKIAASVQGSYVQDKTIKSYGTDYPIYIVYHREHNILKELSEVSAATTMQKRIVRAYIPATQPPEETNGQILTNLKDGRSG